MCVTCISGIFPSLTIGYFSLSPIIFSLSLFSAPSYPTSLPPSLPPSLIGYRHIHLTCSGNGLENASLYVHVGIMDYIGATGKASKAPFKTKKNREVCVPVQCICFCLCVCVRGREKRKGGTMCGWLGG